MGNGDIRDIAHIEEGVYDDISGSTVAVDGNNWLYRYVKIYTEYNNPRTYRTDDKVELPNLLALPSGLKKFYEYNITPVFVFDGGYHEQKKLEVERRKEKRKEAEEKRKDADTVIEKAKERSKAQTVTTEMFEATYELLDNYNIEYIKAPKSAEKQCAWMVNNSSTITAMVSEDYDSVLFKSPLTIRKFTSSGDTIEKMSYEKTIDNNNISHDQLIAAAILMGTDYNEGVYGFGPRTSIKKVKENQSKQDLLDILEDEGVDRKTATIIFDIYTSNEDIVDSYPEPTYTPDPDINAVEQYIKQKIGITDKIQSTIDETKEIVNTNQSSLMDF